MFLRSSGYAQVLDQHDRALRASLLELVKSTDASQRFTASWKIIQGAFESLRLKAPEHIGSVDNGSFS